MEKDPIFRRKRQNYREIKRIFKYFGQRQDLIHLNDQLLAEQGVRLSRLYPERGDQATEEGITQFFSPVDPDSLAKLPRREIGQPEWTPGGDRELIDAQRLLIKLKIYLHGELPEAVRTESHDSLLSFTEWFPMMTPHDHIGGYGHGQFPKERTDWRFGDCYASLDNKFPHLIVKSMHEEDTSLGISLEYKITRSEIVVLTNVLMNHMRSEALYRNEIYPVLMVNVFTHKIRFIQGYFDGELLQMQCSRFLDFTSIEKPTLDLFLRWAMSEPVGDTKPPTKPPASAVKTVSQATSGRRTTSTAIAAR